MKIIIRLLLFIFSNVVWYYWAGNKNDRFWVPFAIMKNVYNNKKNKYK